MKLIVDAGSSGTQWAAVDADGSHSIFECGPINPSIQSPEQVEATIAEAVQKNLLHVNVDVIEFYGSGCRPGRPSEIVEAVFRKAFPEAQIEVQSDMLGACRGAAGGNAGIVCILGTGSNACRYDGAEIVATTPSLGYILGDEGSGADIGRRLVNYAYKGVFRKDLCEAFIAYTGLSISELIEQVYRRPGANTFLASLSRFAQQHLADDEVNRVVVDAFSDFVRRNILPLRPRNGEEVYSVGSIGWAYQGVLGKVLSDFGLTLAGAVKSPLSGLLGRQG